MNTNRINLKILEEVAVENFDIVLEDLEIFDYVKFEDRYQGRCPIHGGDNNTAWCFYLGKNVWNCYTNNCHDEYGNSVFDFVRAIRECSFGESIFYLCDILKFDTKEGYKEREEDYYLKKIRENNLKKEVKKLTFDESCLEKLDDCSFYMKERGFDREIINEFKCGYAKTGRLAKRVVFPVFDDINEIVGFIGRTIFDQCDKCNSFHYKIKEGSCPEFSTRAKWLCSKGLDKKTILYNLNKAKEHIKESGSVIITEGIIDLMRLWSVGVKNVVSPLGVNISNQQLILLLSLGTVRKVYVCSDDDKTGMKFKDKHTTYKDLDEKKAVLSLSRYFNVEKVEYGGKKDIGEMTKEEALEFCKEKNLLKGENCCE